ncbi:MAG: class II aldolase/adducin family protein [Candidatus Methanomethylophilaceae archaeon]|nr:class II aldolase/adducin family protein [Candidatus Methanomethylophilaceae archaeon]MDD3378410.1 class II aldolase/adducin family protein [Candidatus Methanomethylophilaceae archaeon]MDY0224001.1 class II aldolase/adducin family protein [Candidatus Methanomethylophilaceae archaeon]
MNEEFARSRLAKTCKQLYDRNLTVSAGGNMSVRLNTVEIIITPSGRNKGSLQPEDMVKMNLAGEIIGGGKPSIEHKFHLALYEENPETNAVVHCHPLYCTALAVNNKKIKSNITPEGALLLGRVPLIPYYTPGSQELVDAIMDYPKARAMLMSKHGALTQGNTLEEAYNRMEELEFQAKLQILAGRTKDLPDSEIEKICNM